ncbi:MAG: hypothetical protein Q9175_003496 [Cornicularia normoerica]
MAPKSKKPPVEIKPEFELPPPGSEPPRKKKKKNAPDKPQPEWMFPADQENPVLNPNPESETHRLKDEKERDQAINFLQHRSVTAPMKAPPPDLLLTLVGAFLTSYGFNHTSRLYTTQVQSRKKLDAWKTELGAKLPQGFPDLVKIFKEWYKGYQEKSQVEETSSSDSDDSDNAKAIKKSKKAKKAKKGVEAEAKAREAAAAKVIAKDITSSSGSESSDEEIVSDADVKDATPPQKPTMKFSKSSKIKSSPLSTSSSSSDSDADDEKDNAGTELQIPAASQKPTVNGLVNTLKRKASPSSYSSSESESESESDSDTSSSAGVRAVSVNKEAPSLVTSQPQSSVLVSKLSANPSSSDTSSSDTSSSDSESAAELSKSAAATTAVAKAESESSLDSSSSDSESDDDVPKSTLSTTITTMAEASSSSSSSESLSSDSESSEVNFSKPPKSTITKTTKVVTTKPKQVSSDSSVTLQASSVQEPSAVNTNLSSTSSSDSSTSADQQATTTVTTTTTTSIKRKRSSSPTPKASQFTKKQTTPFQRVPQDTLVDPKMASNAYRSYDYADRAHQDLSVTKGKGFTKEKNKKKRGSYRGGAIDVSGGKGFKFED